MTPQFKSVVRKYGPRFLADTALSRIHVAAMFGNFAVETGEFVHLQEIEPTVKGSKGGWGWAQWTGYGRGGRRGLFEAWAKANGYKLADPEAFYGFVLHEFQGSEKAAYDAVRRTKTLDSATTTFMKRYERPGIPHLARRKAYALDALRELNAVMGEPEPAAVAALPPTVPTSYAALPPEATKKPGKARTLWDLIRGKAPLPAATDLPATAAMRGDPTVYNVQAALKAKGFTEVGMVDGIMGDRTEDAILAARKRAGLPLKPTIDAEFLAALNTIQPRPQSSERATADTSDVKAAAPGLLDGLGGIRLAAGTLFGGSLLGGAENTGLLDTIKGTAEQATDTMQSVQSVVATGMGAVSWIANHWWIFGLLLAIYVLAKVGMYALKAVVLFRQGRIL